MPESIRILMLEDNPTDVELIQFELEDAQLVYTSKVVTTEEDFVQELQEYCPDIILSDYDLPKYNGALALAEAKRRCPDTPFILVTGAVTEDRAIEILTKGAKDYVLKARLQQRLAPAVRRALAEAEEQRARKKADEDLREAHRNLESQVAEKTADLQKEIEQRYRVEQSLLRYNERIELLSYTASRLLASDKPQQVVEELCLKVMEFLDCDAFFNFLVDEAAGRLHLNACTGIPKETMREIEWLDYGVAVCGCAARDACRIVAENIPVTPDVRTELVKSFGIKAYACHTLMEQNHVMGTLSFGTRSRTTFSTDDLSMMKAVADQVAVAMSRVRAQDTMRESGMRFQSVLDNSRDVVYRLNLRTDSFEYISPSAEMVIGFSPAELMAQDRETAIAMIHPDDIPAFRAALVRLEETGQEEVEYRQRTKIGDYRWISNYMSLIRDGAGRSLYRDGNIRDITARKQAEAKLHRYELLAARHRDIILFIELGTGRILEANDAATRAYGYTRDELLTLTIHDLRAADRPGLSAEQIAMAFDQGLLFEMIHRSQDGSTFPVEVSAQGAEIDGRRLLISVVHDIAQRKRIETELREKTAALEERTRQMEAANQELESFSYSISHDLRAPLRAIDGYSRMILKKHAGTFNDDAIDKFNVIRESTRMMGQLIEDLLAFSRAGKAELSTVTLDIGGLIREVWEEIKATNPDRRLTLKLAEIPPCKGDPGLIKQVLVNILSNAVKFTRGRAEARIEVGGDNKEGKTVYYIRDNGAGFDMQYHDKLFGVFQRLHSAGEFEGTGVGLAIVQRIINRHGGRVWAEGEVDKGATFYFTLPTQHK